MNKIHSKAAAVCAAALMLLYLAAAFWRLGCGYAPETGWESSEKGKEILLDFGEDISFAGFAYYLGNYENRVFHVEAGSLLPSESGSTARQQPGAEDTSFQDGGHQPGAEDMPFQDKVRQPDTENIHPQNEIQWQDVGMAEMAQVYQWGAYEMPARCRYVRLTTEKVFTDLKELVFLDRDGEQVRPVNEEEYPELFDEADMYPGYQSFRHGTVFDEPVFARTAYEYLHGIRSYEDTHPPLGKLLISVGIAVFGMNPFGWRFMGAAAGAAMLAVLWAFGRRLFKNPWISLFVTTLFAADFLHFSHTRLAQVDSFLVLFIMGMYYFMLRYMEELEEWSTDAFKASSAGSGSGIAAPAKNMGKRLRHWLMLSGICMGCAVSCKWSGFYAAAGLAVLWAGSTFRAWKTWAAAGKPQEAAGKPREAAGEIQEAGGRGVSGKMFLGICAWCVLVFIVVPAVIYTASYIPYVAVDPELGFFQRVINNQRNMFLYHSGMTPEHPYASKWYQWPLIIKPMVYYQVKLGSVQECIILLGNPFLWWSGIGAFFACLYQVLEKQSRKGYFLLVMFLAPLIPWMLVPRSSFLYHYFPCLPPLALMLGLAAERMGRKGTIALGVLAAGAVVLFAVYYPVLSGYPAAQEYLGRLTGWLPWWSWLS